MHCGCTVDAEEKCSFVLQKPVLTLQLAKNSVNAVTRTTVLNEEQHCPLVVKEISYPI